MKSKETQSLMKRVILLFLLFGSVILACSSRLLAGPPSPQQTPMVVIWSLENLRDVESGTELRLAANYFGEPTGVEQYTYFANGIRVGTNFISYWTPRRLGVYAITCVVTLQTGETLDSDPVEIRVSSAPFISVVEPKQSVQVLAPASIDLEVAAGDTAGVIRRVRFFYGTEPLGVVEQPPYRLKAVPLRYRWPITAVAENDRGLTKEVVFPVTVVGMEGDDFYRPFQLTGEHAEARVSNRDASDQVADTWPETPLHAGHKSIWWTWKAPADGTATLSTEGSNFDTVLGVLVRTNVGNVVKYSRLMTSRDGTGVGPASLAKLRVLQGTEYRIVVDGEFGSFGGDIRLGLDFVRTEDHFAPRNDLIALRQRLSGREVEQAFSSLGASLEPGERNILTNLSGGKSVWFEWVPPVSGVATITTRGSRFDTVLGVYGATSDPPDVTKLTLQLANDDDPEGGSHSTVRLPVLTGSRILMVVDGFWGEGGEGVLKIHLDPRNPVSPPVNDSIADRIPISDDRLIQYGLAWGIASDPSAPQVMPRALWWSWTPKVDQTAFVTTAGSSYATQLGIFSADTLGGWVREALTTSPLDVGDRGTQAEAFFVAVAGREYLLGVATESQVGGEGTIQLQVIPGQPLQGLPLIALGGGAVKGTQWVSLGVATSRRALLMASPDLVNWRVVRTNTFEPGARLSVWFADQATGFLKAFEWNNR